ncbi:hypothetical protein AV530_015950 [Patagioenas fasciata monilis]|uniref:Uncharacterized protein n=1 Tax=Patagioenas fasciata monilis TaxID=372326 RepID=A0A1V4KJD9_PATFA|nr:hypothetical protein AV530_015950 [Patagioenas fasciata monilis]
MLCACVTPWNLLETSCKSTMESAIITFARMSTVQDSVSPTVEFWRTQGLASFCLEAAELSLPACQTTVTGKDKDVPLPVPPDCWI